MAASAARVSLSGRSARRSGLAASRATSARRPTTMPACGPPRSLSPLNVTRSAPSAIRSRTTGSRREAERARGRSSAPLPRSSTTGTPASRPIATSSGERDARREADDPVVAGVDLHEERRPGADRARGSPRDACDWWCRPRAAALRSSPSRPGCGTSRRSRPARRARRRRPRSAASVFSASSTAAALLLTTIAASAPVSAHRSSRDERVALATPAASPDRARGSTAPRAAASTALQASSASGARPRFVWSTIPVALMTGPRRGVGDASRRAANLAIRSSSAGTGAPSLLTSARTHRMVSTTCPRLNRARSGAAAGAFNSRSTDGIARRGFTGSIVPEAAPSRQDDVLAELASLPEGMLGTAHARARVRRQRPAAGRRAACSGASTSASSSARSRPTVLQRDPRARAARARLGHDPDAPLRALRQRLQAGLPERQHRQPDDRADLVPAGARARGRRHDRRGRDPACASGASASASS